MANYLIQPKADFDVDPDDISGATWAMDAADPDTITGLTNGTAYVAREFALSPASAEFTPATVPSQMSAPSLAVDSATQITATLASDPASGGSAITSYDLRHSTDEATWTPVTGITSPHAITGLDASTLYYVQTRAVNAIGNGAWSTSASATTSAGSGALFSDDFTSQTLNSNLADDSDWSRVDGFLDVKVEDASGTRVARSPSGITQVAHLSVQGSYPAARKVTVDLHSVRAGGAAGNAITAYLNYVDADNYTSVTRDTSGFTSVRHRASGVNEASQTISGSVWDAGERLTMTLDGGTLSVEVDSVAIGASPWSSLTMPTAAQPGVYFNANSADTTRTAISLFEVDNP